MFTITFKGKVHGRRLYKKYSMIYEDIYCFIIKAKF